MSYVDFEHFWSVFWPFLHISSLIIKIGLFHIQFMGHQFRIWSSQVTKCSDSCWLVIRKFTPLNCVAMMVTQCQDLSLVTRHCHSAAETFLYLIKYSPPPPSVFICHSNMQNKHWGTQFHVVAAQHKKLTRLNIPVLLRPEMWTLT